MRGYSLTLEYELRKIISEQAVEITQLLKRITELEVNLNALQTKYEELADDYIDLKESK